MHNIKKTKIFYIITKGNFGGAQRYVFDLATNLPKKDFEVGVILGEGKILEQKLKQEGIRVIQLNQLQRDISLIKEIKILFSLIKILHQERPDIIHLNSSKIGGLGSLAGRLAGIKKIIFTAHGWAFNENRPTWQKKSIKVFHWLSIFFSHQTIVVAPFLKKQVSHWPLIQSKITIINNGLPTIKFFDQQISRHELLPEQKNKFWIGTISELHKNKGLDFLIEAFASTVRSMLAHSLGWSLILVIIGEGEERANLEKLIRSKHLEDRIFLLGRIEDARSYLKAFDIFTLTSRTEALPYALLEAGSAGLPIVASEVGGISEIIPDPEYGILVPTGNIEEIKKSLVFMLKRSPYRKIAGTNIKKHIKENFSLKEMVEKTINLYR